MLQHMPGLRTADILQCDLSSGLPNTLCQLRNISDLALRGTNVSSLPPLACMPGESDQAALGISAVVTFVFASCQRCVLLQPAATPVSIISVLHPQGFNGLT